MDSKTVLKKLFSGMLWGNCLGMLVVVALLLLGSVWFLDFYTHHGKVVQVPNIVGKNYNVAKGQLRDVDLIIEVIDTGYIKTLPPDIILQQSIKGGTKVKPGRIIQVTINSAHARTLALPDIADNSSYREAESRLKAMGFQVAAPKYTAGDRDWVYGVEVNGKSCKVGDRIPVNQPITLVVGDGKIYEAYNGNDSLDYEINGDMYDEDDVDEGLQ